jgi:hypothetical protein
MAARWVGLSRPNKKNVAARAIAKRDFGQTIHEFLHVIGAVGFLMIAAAMNFALYPDALAAVVGGERAALGFVPDESAFVAAQAPATAPLPVDEKEVRLLAATAWGEARSEGEDGMRAVAHVMVNRVGQRFGDSLETVIHAPKQFSVWNRGDPNRRLVSGLAENTNVAFGGPEWEAAQRIAREVLSGQSVDPTNGALFYHTRAIRPYWSHHGEGRRVIGAHVFYRDVPDRYNRARMQAIRATQRGGRVTQTAAAGPRRRAGRVNGVVQYAPPGFTGGLPAPTTTIETSAPAPAVPAPLPAAALTTATGATS